MLAQTMVMTGSDLCCSAKPWLPQCDTVADIYREFHLQGDLELASGRLPIPIMKRCQQTEQARHQVTSHSVLSVHRAQSKQVGKSYKRVASPKTKCELIISLLSLL